MDSDYTIYIDESCHLLNDGFPIMAIGYTKVPNRYIDIYRDEFKNIQKKHQAFTEVKWTSISNKRLDFYKDIVDFFFSNEISFRCIYNKTKKELDHAKFNNNDHNLYYYKLIFLLIDTPTNPPDKHYSVLIDIKDNYGAIKNKGIKEVLSNKYFNNSPFVHFQNIHSHESYCMQIADLLLGAITYKLRGEHLSDGASKAKLELINYIEANYKVKLEEGTNSYEAKFNVFDHSPLNK